MVWSIDGAACVPRLEGDKVWVNQDYESDGAVSEENRNWSRCVWVLGVAGCGLRVGGWGLGFEGRAFVSSSWGAGATWRRPWVS